MQRANQWSCGWAILVVAAGRVLAADPLPLDLNMGRNRVGSVTRNGGGSYTVVGGGNDTWDLVDEGTFAYAEVCGDFDLRVRVEYLEPTARWTKAGLMVRESLAEDSRMAFQRVTPAPVQVCSPDTDNATGANDLRFAYRTGNDEPTGSFGDHANGGRHEDGTNTPAYPNAWLRLQRLGSVVYGYSSSDGTNWVQDGAQDTATWQGGALQGRLKVGLWVSRHDNPGPNQCLTARCEFRSFVLQTGISFQLCAADSLGASNAIRVFFSRSVRTNTALNPGNYSLSPFVPVVAVSVGQTPDTVNLSTGPLSEGTNYLLTVAGLLDSGGNPLNPNPAAVNFRHGAGYERRPLRLAFNRIPGATVDFYLDSTAYRLDLPVASLGRNAVNNLALFEDDTPSDQLHENFSARISGLLNVTNEGDYRFACASDDAGRLFLSTDDQPLNKVEIAREPEWAGLRNFANARPGDGENASRGTPPANLSAPLHLKPGRYYLEYACSEGGGGNSAAVTWDAGFPARVFANGDPPIGSGTCVPFRMKDGLVFYNLGPVVVTRQPQNTQVYAGQSPRFDLRLDGAPPYRIQWLTNNVAVPGANGLRLTLSPAASADAGKSIRAVVSNEWSGVTSATAILSVNPQPVVLGCATRNSPTNVFVTWSKPVRLTGLYTIDGGGSPVSSRAYGEGSNIVVLTTVPISPDTFHGLLIQDVTDPAGNVQASNPTNCLFVQGPGRLCVDFNGFLPTNAVLSGNAYVGSDGILHLTDAANDEEGSVVFDLGAPATFFRASFKALVGDGTSPPADGFSFCYGSDVTGLFGEEGIGNGLIVSFDTYDNGGEGTPSVDLKWHGVPFAHVPTSLITGSPANFFDVVIELSLGGQVTVSYGGNTLYSGIQIPGYAPVTGNARFGFGARTGAANEHHWIDDFCLNDGFTLGGVAATVTPSNPTVAECSIVTFSAAVTGSPPYFYQWLRNGAPISGATGPGYTLPALVCPQDQGAVYSVVASNLFSRASALSTVTLACDNVPPGIASVGSLNGCTVGVCFSKAVDPAAATNPLNYRLNDDPPGVGIVPPILLRPDGKSVQFSVEPCLTGTFTVEADAILDACPARNAAPSSGTGTVQGLSSADIGTPGDPNPPGTDYTCADDQIEITTGGSDTWGTADHNHFVYAPRVGDFDVMVKVVRLDYQTPWSKAGLMARVTLDPDSPVVATYHTPTTGANQVEAGLRTSFGGDMFDWGAFRPPASDAPYLRLQRLGGQFFAYHSADGINWILHADSSIYPADQWPANLFVGVFATPNNGNNGSTTTAEFRGFGPSPECYTVFVPPGLTLIANQLNNGPNTLNVILRGVPPGSTLYKWLNADQRWQVASYDEAFGAWVPANSTLNPGEGAYFFNPDQPFELQFCGRRPTPILPVDLVPGWNLVSSQTPEPGPYEIVIGAAPSDGTVAARWTGVAYDLATFLEGVGWDPFPPTVSVGEPMFIVATPGGPSQLVFPPGIGEPPSDQIVPRGGTAEFSVGANGTPPLRYQWRLNGVDIPGATNVTLTLLNVQFRDAGSYSVKVQNAGGACISLTARLRLSDLPTVLPGDDFGERRAIAGVSGALTGNNLGFTGEPGEPLHAGKPGGRSAWYSWTAPAQGIVTFSTAGSAFDTLLAIYTGTNVASLARVASDEDQGGFLTSQAQFAVSTGTRYQIAIDGLGGREGEFILSWQLESTAQPLPVILSQPVSLTVPPGAGAAFAVVAAGSGLTYRWFHNGSPVGPNGPSLTISNAQPSDAGRYVVAITNSFGRGIESLPAVLEIGSLIAVRSRDKVEDLYATSGSDGKAGTFGGRPLRLALGSGTGGFLPVTAGTTDAHTLNNTGASSSPGEPLHCGVGGGSSRWFGLQAEGDGVMIIDTIGAGIDTVLAVYSAPPVYTETFWFEIQLVACDDNGAPDGRASQVAFNAHRGTNYAIAVDGVGGAQGTIPLHYRFVARTNMLVTSTNALVRVNSDVALKAESSGLPSPTYRWRRQDANLPDATNRTLLLPNAQFSQGGNYAIVIRSPSQSITQSIARLTVAQLGYKLNWIGKTPSFKVTGQASDRVVLDGSTNLPVFGPAWTNPPGGAPFEWVDPQSGTTTQRNFRLRPWPD